MTVAAIFGGVVLLLILNAWYQFGVFHGVKVEIVNRLPGGSLLRRLLLQPEVVISNALDRVAANPVRWAIRMFLIAYLIGGVTFSLLEPSASVFDGLWWAYISMMTVGYGDYSPKTWFIRTEAYIVVFLGWSSLLIMGAALSGRIAERRMKRATMTEELYDDIEAICEDLLSLEERLHTVASEQKRREKEGNYATIRRVA